MSISQRLALRRKRAPVRLLALSMALAMTGCVESIDHDNLRAAKKAEEFVAAAFVTGDGERGYELLAPATKRYVSLEQFKLVLTRLHPRSSPKNVRAFEYEPMTGEKAIYIFLAGEHSGEQFYYRITMVGTKATEYQVLKFDRSLEPYPPSPNRKPLGK